MTVLPQSVQTQENQVGMDNKCVCGLVSNYENSICANVTDRSIAGKAISKSKMYNCVKKPWMVLVLTENKNSPADVLTEACAGSIINKRYVISAAHCFCNAGIIGVKCIWNDGKRGAKMPNGHFEFVNSTMGSRIDYNPFDFVTVVTPGLTESYRIDQIRLTQALNPEAVYRAEGVTIHPDYVMSTRDEADIALVRLDRDILFKIPDVMPICLPSHGFKDVDVEARVAGWGLLFEKDESRGQAACHTNGQGPAQFTPCRKRFVQDGTLFSLKKGCLTTQPPVELNEVCKELHEKVPSTLSTRNIVEVDGKVIRCYAVTRQHLALSY